MDLLTVYSSYVANHPSEFESSPEAGELWCKGMLSDVEVTWWLQRLRGPNPIHFLRNIQVAGKRPVATIRWPEEDFSAHEVESTWVEQEVPFREADDYVFEVPLPSGERKLMDASEWAALVRHSKPRMALPVILNIGPGHFVCCAVLLVDGDPSVVLLDSLHTGGDRKDEHVVQHLRAAVSRIGL
jgi:hypothetical protein